MEIAIIFTVFCKMLFDVSGMWPNDILPEEESIEEKVLLSSLCTKCGIDGRLPKVEKFEKIQKHLLTLLQVRQALEEENFKTVASTQSYVAGKVMSETPWRRLRFVIEEALSNQANLAYSRLVTQEFNKQNPIRAKFELMQDL